jgi:hypothetical protein
VQIPERTTDEVDADVVECVEEMETRDEGHGADENVDAEVVEGVEEGHCYLF